jgi:hypothetical protein
VHTRERGQLGGFWLSVGPKLVFDQMAAPAPETMHDSLCMYVVLLVPSVKLPSINSVPILTRFRPYLGHLQLIQMDATWSNEEI